MENKQIVDELIEEIGNNQEIVKSFEVRDSLSNDIFDVKDGEFFMHDEIRKKLMDVLNNLVTLQGNIKQK